MNMMLRNISATCALLVATVAYAESDAKYVENHTVYYRPEQLLQPQEGDFRCFELRDAVMSLQKSTKETIDNLAKRENELQSRAASNRLDPKDPKDLKEFGALMKEGESLKIDRQLAQRRAEAEQMKIMQQFDQKLQQVLDALREGRSELSKGRKFKAILPITAGASIDESLDITDDIIEALNGEYRKEQRAKKMKAASASAKGDVKA